MTALAVKSTFVIFAALLFVLAARRTRASLRHMVLAALFAFLLLLPAAERLAPAIEVPRGAWASGLPLEAMVTPEAHTTPPEGRPEAHTTRAEGRAEAHTTRAEGGPEAHTTRVGRMPSPFTVYVIGAGLLLAWLAIGIFRLRRLAANGEVWLEGTARMNEIAHEAGIRRPALVVVSDETKVPLTFGFRMSTIVLPLAAKSWDDQALGRAIRHELEHVRRDDWVMQLLARAVCAIYWPHPLVWAAWRRFCFEAERACDDAVVGSFEGAEAYAGQLVSLARSVRGVSTVPALGMASRSKLAARVRALLDASQRRGPHSRLATAFAVAITFLFLFTVAPAKLVAAAKHTETYTERTDRDRNWSWFGEAMAKAGERGDLAGIRELLDAGIDVNTVAEGDGTALIGASKGGHLEVVRFLIERGADVNLASRGDGNPLIGAAKHGHLRVVELLLDEGARIDEMVHGDENALIQAAWHGHVEVVELLIRRGANVNARYVDDGRIRTPLRMARGAGHDEIVRILRAAGARD